MEIELDQSHQEVRREKRMIERQRRREDGDKEHARQITNYALPYLKFLHFREEKKSSWCNFVFFSHLPKHRITTNNSYKILFSITFWFSLSFGLLCFRCNTMVKRQQIVHIWFGKVVKEFLLPMPPTIHGIFQRSKTKNECSWLCCCCCFFTRALLVHNFYLGDSDSWQTECAAGKHFCLSR